MINSQGIVLEELGQALHEIFRTKAEKLVFVRGDGAISFQDVATVIAIAGQHVDYISVVTPKVARQSAWRADMCLDSRVRPSSSLF